MPSRTHSSPRSSTDGRGQLVAPGRAAGLRKASPPSGRREATAARTAAALRCRRKFLRFFPGGFRDAKYIDWERGYKQEAHERWEQRLGRSQFHALLAAGRFAEVATLAVGIESRTNLLFSFEKMAVRDAVRTPAGARRFAEGLWDLLHGTGPADRRVERWCQAVAVLPRRQTRVLTWPVVTVFGFLAQPEVHMFYKPTVTRLAARLYGVDLPYSSRPSWAGYAALLDFARAVRRDVRDLRPRDMIDIQSFIWVQGSSEYDE